MLIVTEFLPDPAKKEEEILQLDSKKQSQDELIIPNNRQRTQSYEVTLKNPSLTAIFPNRKSSEIITSKEFIEKVPKGRSSLELDPQTQLLDMHDPQLLKKMLVQNEKIVTEKEKPLQMTELGQANVTRRISDSYKRIQG